MGVIRHKIWRDLWTDKARTVQVVLIVAVGAFAVGMIITTRNLVIAGMRQSWLESKPAMIAMAAGGLIDEDSLRDLKRIQGVREIEGYSASTAEWRLNDDDEWKAANVVARENYADQRFFVINPTQGALPSGNVIDAVQGTDTVFGAGLGKTITIRVEGRERKFKVGGIVSDPISMPPSFGGNAQFYVSQRTFDDLFGWQDFNMVLADAQSFDADKVKDLANEMGDRLERQGINTYGYMPPSGSRVLNPEKHFFQDSMDAIFYLLGVMAILALFLGLFLVYNTISAVLTQQTDQIGVMKAIGASTWQILMVYLLYVLSFGIMALFLSIPLGALLGWALYAFLMGAFNADPGAFTVSPMAIWAEVAIAILTPLLVAIIPLIAGARITVREAISTYGLSLKPSLLDRGVAHLKHVSRILLLTISNTFRHKGRVVMTQITLVLSGLIFMMVMSVAASATYTFNDVLFSILNSDINLLFSFPQRIVRMEKMAMQNPQVSAAEMWGFASATSHLQDVPGTDDDPTATIFGVEPDTVLYGYQMRAGRWLEDEDERTVVLNQILAEDIGAGVGDWVTFDQGVNGESDWLVVGLIFDPLLTNTAQVPRDALLREQNYVGRASLIWIKLKRGDAATEQIVVKQLRQMYEDNGIDVAPNGALEQDTSSEVVNSIQTRMRFILVLLSTMAVVIGVVGSISLSGVLSLAVIERQREIGVMRAIGASSWAIARLFVGEGLILGWLSWLIAFPLSLPAGRLMTAALSSALGTELVYHYTPQGALLWLLIISVLATLASWLPARRATRISVRESLAYQ